MKKKTIIKQKENHKQFIADIRKQLKQHKRVKVNGLGIFEVRVMKPRRSFNPWTNKDIVVPKHKKIGFKPEKKLKDFISK